MTLQTVVRAVTLLLCIALLSAAPPLAGRFALQSGVTKTQGHLRATPIRGKRRDEHLDVWLTQGESQTVERYGLDMTKYMHLILVSDDFATFIHVHPLLQRNGHFTLDLRLPRATLYHVYADAEPGDLGQQVFRFDLDLATAQPHTGRDVAPTGSVVAAGPYQVTLDSTRLRSGGESALKVHIRRNAMPAIDLHPYLGALAHAVFIDARDLSYAHAHPLPLGNGMPSMSGGMRMPALPNSAHSAPDMLLHVAVREAGTYKLWLQFRGGDGLYVAPFVLTAV